MTDYENYIGSAQPGIIQFENANEGRSYPFVDDSTLESDDGRILSDDVVVDMHLVIPKGTEARLSSVYISEHMVSVCIVVSGGPSVAALSCIVKATELVPYAPYRMEKLTGSEDVGGIVTFGQVDFKSAPGPYRFSKRAVRVSESAVSMYTPARLRKIVDPRTGKSVSGDVKIEFSSYIDVSTGDDGVSLSMSAGANDMLLPKCDKVQRDLPCGAVPINSINGVAPDSRKRIVLWFH